LPAQDRAGAMAPSNNVTAQTNASGVAGFGVKAGADAGYAWGGPDGNKDWTAVEQWQDSDGHDLDSVDGFPQDKNEQIAQNVGKLLSSGQKFEIQDDSKRINALSRVQQDSALEEALGTDGKSTARRNILKMLGIQAILTAAKKERSRRAMVTYENRFPCLARVVESAWFELVMGIVMLLNALLVGVEASLSETPAHQDVEDIFGICEHVFTAIFVIELGMRLLVFGWTWLLETLNALDVALILFTGVLPMWILGPAGVQSGLVRVLQVLRVLRLVRLVRMFKTVRSLRTAYKLTQGLFDSGTIIFHTYCIMGTVLFMISVFSVYFVGRSESLDNSVERHREIRESFATVPIAMFTLFDISTMNNWVNFVRPTQDYTAAPMLLSVLIIMVVNLVLGNLITAVIITRALNRFKEDEDFAAAEKKSDEEQDVRLLRRVFRDALRPGAELLTREDYFEAMSNSKSEMRERFACMEISYCEIEEVWELLNPPDRGVDEESFCFGVRAMKGPAMAKDSFAAAQHIRRINQRMSRMSARLARCKQDVDRLRSDVATTRKDLSTALREVHVFLKHVGVCVPPEPITKIPKHFSTFQQQRVGWRWPKGAHSALENSPAFERAAARH